MAPILIRRHELAFRTQYAELKERVLAAGLLLPGTPGTLARRSGTGYEYWYRVFYSVPGHQCEEFVCRDGDEAALRNMSERIEFAAWVVTQVSSLKKLGFQAADKPVARVLVELHNRGAFEAGLVLVGTLAFMAWLNELGVIVASARTQDIDLARGEPLKLAAPLPFMQTLLATRMPFVEVPGMPRRVPASSVKLPGVEGLRVDLLVPGASLGAVVRVPELEWCAQSVPYLEYLLEEAEPAAILAGGQCVPIRVPQASRLVWHKLYASTQRRGFAEKGVKDRRQALTLLAALAEDDPTAVGRAFDAADPAMLRPVRPLLGGLADDSRKYPQAVELLADCLSGRPRR